MPPIWNISHCTACQRSAASAGSRRPVFSARYSRIAPDSNKASGLPPGPSGSRIAGILLFGLTDRNSSVNWSRRSKSTRCTSEGSPVSSRKIETFTPLGVGSE